jgi:putative transposase
VENGPQYASMDFKLRAIDLHIGIHCIQQGRIRQDDYIERINGGYRRQVLDGYVFFSLLEVRELTDVRSEGFNIVQLDERLDNATLQETAQKYLVVMTSSQ